MKVILLKDIPNIGKKFEVKNVADGLAINMLIPRKQAELATGTALKRIEKEIKQGIEDERVRDSLLAKDLEKLSSLILEFKEKANEKGHLFAGIHKEEVSAKIKEQTRLEVLPEHILMEKPIKEIGEYVVPLRVGEKRGSVQLIVTAKA